MGRANPTGKVWGLLGLRARVDSRVTPTNPYLWYGFLANGLAVRGCGSIPHRCQTASTVQYYTNKKMKKKLDAHTARTPILHGS